MNAILTYSTAQTTVPQTTAELVLQRAVPESRSLKSSRPILRLCWALTVATLCTGCIFGPPHPETYGYVFDVGNADQITKWALAKKDADQIADALGALSSLIAKDQQPLRAIAGIDQIHEKLVNGWPGLMEGGVYRPDILRGYGMSSTEHLIGLCYAAIAETSGPPAALKAEYLKMRPSDPARLEEWKRRGPDRLRNFRKDLVPR
jgi:hypothetical protein